MTTDTKPLALMVADIVESRVAAAAITGSVTIRLDIFAAPLEDARELAALLREAGGWRPIESAPRDRLVWAWGDGWHWGGEGRPAYVHSDFNGHKNVVTRDGRCGPPFRLGSKDAPTLFHPLPAPPAAGGA